MSLTSLRFDLYLIELIDLRTKRIDVVQGSILPNKLYILAICSENHIDDDCSQVNWSSRTGKFFLEKKG